MIALFDWDAFIYRAAFAAQKVIRHVTIPGEEFISSFASAKEMYTWLEEQELSKDDVEVQEELVVRPFNFAKKVLESRLTRCVGYVHSGSSELYITGKDNFRTLLYPQYKANRTRAKPVHLKALMDYSVERLGATVVDGMEADDMLTIRATELDEAGKEWVIISPDKDLRTMPGHHYDPFKEDYKVIDPLEAAFNFYSQVLTGDTADNIPGVYKCGPVKATRLLEDCYDEHEMWEVCKGVYAEAGIPDEDLIRNARLLHMLRHKKDLWEPPCLDE